MHFTDPTLADPLGTADTARSVHRHQPRVIVPVQKFYQPRILPTAVLGIVFLALLSLGLHFLADCSTPVPKTEVRGAR